MRRVSPGGVGVGGRGEASCEIPEPCRRALHRGPPRTVLSEHEQFEEMSTQGDLALDCQSLNGIVRHGMMVRVPEGKKDMHISVSEFGWGQRGIHTWR